MIEVSYPYSPCLTDLSARDVVLYGRKLAERISGRIDPECGLTVWDVIFAAGRSIASRAGKADKDGGAYDRNCSVCFLEAVAKPRPLYVLPLEKSEKGCSVGEPQRVIISLDNAPEKLARKLQKKNSSLARKPIGVIAKAKIAKEAKALRFKLGQGLMKSAARDRMFVARFNQETFLKGLSVSDKPLYTALSALYAIAFHQLTLRDIYHVDSIFSADEQDSREKDMLKNQSAYELVQIMESDSGKLIQAFDKMSRTLASLTLPPVDLSQMTMLAENYTCYAGVANMAAAWIKLLRQNKELAEGLLAFQGDDYSLINRRINDLYGFSAVVSLCDEAASVKSDTLRRLDLKSLDGYAEAERSAAETGDKKLGT